MTTASLVGLALSWAASGLMIRWARRRMTRHTESQLDEIAGTQFNAEVGHTDPDDPEALDIIITTVDDLRHGIYALPWWLRFILLGRSARRHGPRVMREGLEYVTAQSVPHPQD